MSELHLLAPDSGLAGEPSVTRLQDDSQALESELVGTTDLPSPAHVECSGGSCVCETASDDTTVSA